MRMARGTGLMGLIHDGSVRVAISDINLYRNRFRHTGKGTSSLLRQRLHDIPEETFATFSQLNEVD